MESIQFESNRMIFESWIDYIPFGDELRMFLNCEEEVIEAEEQGYMVQGRSKVDINKGHLGKNLSRPESNFRGW